MVKFEIVDNRSAISLSHEWVVTQKFNQPNRFIDQDGKRVGVNHKGKLYYLLEKGKKPFSLLEKIEGVLLRVLALVGIMFLMKPLLSAQKRQTIHALLTKDGWTKHFAVEVPEKLNKNQRVLYGQLLAQISDHKRPIVLINKNKPLPTDLKEKDEVIDCLKVNKLVTGWRLVDKGKRTSDYCQIVEEPWYEPKEDSTLSSVLSNSVPPYLKKLPEAEFSIFKVEKNLQDNEWYKMYKFLFHTRKKYVELVAFRATTILLANLKMENFEQVLKEADHPKISALLPQIKQCKAHFEKKGVHGSLIWFIGLEPTFTKKELNFFVTAKKLSQLLFPIKE